MQLTVFDRLTLSAILPPNVGSLAEMVEIGRLRKKLALTDEEKELCEYKEDEIGGGRWLPNKADDAEFDLDEREMELILSGFTILEANGNVPTDQKFIDLYEKINA